MPNVSDRKLKLLYLLQMLWEGTDSQHALTLPQMLEGLEARGIQAERKSLYDDLETLRQFGLPIATRKTRNFEYFLSERPFSQEELALLIDAVCSAGFLSRRRAAQLVKKVAALGGKHQADALLSAAGDTQMPRLSQELQPPQPEKSPSPSGEALLRRAMERDVQVVFQTKEWSVTSRGTLKQAQKTVAVSPWRLSRQGGALHLLAYESQTKECRWFPVAELSQLELLSLPREGEQALPGPERLVLEFPSRLLGQAARFDAVLSTAVAAALYCALATLGSFTHCLTKKKSAAVIFTFYALLFLAACLVQVIPIGAVVLYLVVFWGIIPICMIVLEKAKNGENSRKRY